MKGHFKVHYSNIRRLGARVVARLRIREIAESKGISQGLLARKANVTQNVIRRIWRNPRHNINFDTLEKIAAALDVQVRDLFENDAKE